MIVFIVVIAGHDRRVLCCGFTSTQAVSTGGILVAGRRGLHDLSVDGRRPRAATFWTATATCWSPNRASYNLVIVNFVLLQRPGTPNGNLLKVLDLCDELGIQYEIALPRHPGPALRIYGRQQFGLAGKFPQIPRRPRL
ncbi:MAG: hypothetical protein ACLU3I_00550 [Acutalibacteraceae bacterium]